MVAAIPVAIAASNTNFSTLLRPFWIEIFLLKIDVECSKLLKEIKVVEKVLKAF